MSPQQPASVVDLAENMDEIDLSSDSDADFKRTVDSAQAGAASNKKGHRKSKRGSKRRGGKLKKRANTQDDQALTRASSPSSDAPTVATVLLRQPEELSELPASKHTDKKSKGIVNVWVPVMPHYEYLAIPSNMKNEASDSSTVDKRKHAVFATEDIKQGTRIICEPPLITLPYPGADIRQLMHAYAKLPKYEQERIWDLDPSDLSASPLLETLAQLTEPILKRTVQIICKPKEDWTKEEAKDFEQSGTVLEQVLPTLRLAARWHASSRSMIDIPENERDKLPEGTPITGLFVETAGLRHSCVPNCYAHYNPVTDRMTVHTTRAIACGEELTLSSIAGIYYQTASVRASELKEKYGITCKCEACDSSHANFKKHEDARLRTNGRATLLGHFLTMLEIVDSDKVLKDLCLSSHIRPERQPSKEELENNAQTVLDLIKDLKVTGCEGPELIRWYNALIDRLQPRIAEALSGEKKLGLWKVILGRANGCELIAKRCFGEDSEEFKELQKRKERIAEVLMNAEEHAKTLKESKKKIIRS